MAPRISIANGITAVQADEPDMAIDVVRAGKGALANALLVLAQRISMSDANEVWARYYRTSLSEASKKPEPEAAAYGGALPQTPVWPRA